MSAIDKFDVSTTLLTTTQLDFLWAVDIAEEPELNAREGRGKKGYFSAYTLPCDTKRGGKWSNSPRAPNLIGTCNNSYGMSYGIETVVKFHSNVIKSPLFLFTSASTYASLLTRNSPKFGIVRTEYHADHLKTLRPAS